MQNWTSRAFATKKALVKKFIKRPLLPVVNPSNNYHAAHKKYVDDSVTTAQNNVISMFQYPGKRQTVLYGKVDANNRSNFLSAGTGLQAVLSAATTNFVATIAGGYNPKGGVNYPISITSDQNFNSLSASTTVFFYLDYNTSNGVITYGNGTTAPTYSKSPPTDSTTSLQHFDGSNGATSATDDIAGITWTFAGTAALTTTSPKFGTACLGGLNSVNTTANYVQTTSVVPDTNKFTQEIWVKFTTVDANTNTWIMGDPSAYRWGISLINSSVNKIYLSLGGGASWSIVNGNAGTKADYVANTWYKVTVEKNGLTWKIYINGTLDQTYTAGSNPTISGVRFGNPATVYSAIDGCRANFDEYRLTNGTNRYGANHTPESAALSIPVYEWFDTAKFIHRTGNTVIGWTDKTRLYIGEATTDGSSVTSIISYALNGEYVSAVTAVVGATAYPFSDNLGTSNKFIYAFRRENSTLKFTPMIKFYQSASYGGTVSTTDRNTSKVRTMTNIGSGTTDIDETDSFTSSPATTGEIYVKVERAF